MATKKEEPKYIGRYGEVLEDVKEWGSTIDDPSEPICLRGWGVDENGVKREVLFHVSRKTGKKCGRYLIYRPKEEGGRRSPIIEVCNYLNDLLHGDDVFYNSWGTEIKEIYFLRGRQLNGKGYIGNAYNGGPIFGEEEKRARKNTAEKSRDLRELFSDTSVKEAIKTGNILKVKSAMTRALKKKEMGE
ncbi:MAG: hypothetical protein IKS41_05650 [Alphaproteobacteria bacterium]|nr:hypothetical protein [Alphaproteobacteria bacterium]